MARIIIEVILAVALVAGLAALALAVVWRTPLGLRLRQSANRRRIDRAAELRCAVHGLQDERELVRLPTGERICPACYREAVHGAPD
jgi:hypothetical protein